MHTVESLDPTTKVKIYMKHSKVKKIDKKIKNKQQLNFWMIKSKTEHKNSTPTIWYHI